MEEDKQVILDWVHLPAGVKAGSLWDALHDARLYFVASDPLARTATLCFEIFYLKDGVTITFNLDGVTSLRATRAARWPGGYERPEGISRGEESRLIAEYQAKWREESLDWTELEAALGSANFSVSDDDKDYLDISSAYVVQNGTETTLHFQGHLQSTDLWHELFLRGSHLNVVRSDDGEFSLERLLALGEAWWDGFAEEETN